MSYNKAIGKYPFILLFPIVLVLPIPLIFGSISLGLAIANLLVVNYKEFSWRAVKNVITRPFVILLIFVFFLETLTNIFRSFEFSLTIREVRLSFLIVPMCLMLTKTHLVKIKDHILQFFVIGVLLYIVYADLYLIYFYNYMPFADFKFDDNLKYAYTSMVPGAYHHTYQGLYMCFSIIVLLYFVFYKNILSKKIGLFLCAFIFAHMLFMSGKMTLILIILLSIVMIYNKVETKFLKINKHILFGMVAVLLITIFYFLFKNKVYDSIYSSFYGRIESWKCSFEIFKNNPFFGVEHKFVSELLKECMVSDAISVHNQFLDELVNYGCFSVWIVVFFLLLFKEAHKNILFKMFICLVFFVSLYENIFSLQRGVLFIVFFSSLFLCYKKNPLPLR